MQQGPLSIEQQKQQIDTLLKALHEGTTKVAAFNSINEKVSYIRIVAAKAGLSLNDKQITHMLEQQATTVDTIMALQTKPSDPNTRLAVQIALILGVAFFSRPVAGVILTNIATQQIGHGLLDRYLGIYHKAVEAALVAANLAFGDYNLPTLSKHAMQQLEQALGPGIYIAIPAAMILYTKGPAMLAALRDSELVKTTSDFTDLIYGMADEKPYAKYKGSLATMPIEEVPGYIASGVGSTLNWLWNKVPSLRHQPSTTTPELLAHPVCYTATTSSLKK